MIFKILTRGKAMRNIKEVRKEVEEMSDKLGEPVDPKIKELVIGLRALGIETIHSCQGHSGEGHGLPYPWIDLQPKDANKLLKVVYWYNIRAYQKRNINKVIAWTILPRATIRLMPERKDIPLEKLQKSAVDFGKKIQKLKDIPKLYKYL